MTINNHEAKHRLIDKWLVANGPWALRGATPTDGAFYKDTDRNGAEFRYNTASGFWLSTTEYPAPMGLNGAFVNNLAATLTTAMWANFPQSAAVIYVTRVEITHKTATTFSVAANWSFGFSRGGAGGSYAGITSFLTWQTGRSAGVVYTDPYPVNAAFSVALTGTGITNNTNRFSLDANKSTGAPGNMEITGATIWYRLVG